MDILLETQRLRLRRFTLADLDRLVELDADPEVMRYITYGVPTAREAYESVYLPRWFALYESQPGRGYFAAELLETGAFIGWFHLRQDRIEPQYTELGYRLRRDAWGLGHATEGSRALVRHGFEALDLEAISARTLVGNTASQRVMQKCGLRETGRFVYPEDVIARPNEDERAAVLYTITRSEWLAPTA